MGFVRTARTVALLGLLALHVSASYFLFEDPKEERLHPRTFYLTTYQENELISRVFCEGSNEREQKYAATLPLLIQVDLINTRSSKTPRRNPWCLMTYTVGMFLPHYWGAFPEPNQGSLRFEQLKEGLQVYVHTYSGPTKNLMLKELDAFRQALDQQNLCYKPRRFYIAVYEIPEEKTRDIRNEIWMEKCARTPYPSEAIQQQVMLRDLSK